MGNQNFLLISLLALAMAVTIIPLETQALVPAYSKSRLWDMMMLPTDDPFRILEQVPIAFPKGVESLPLARADWKETTRAHVISIDMPGIKKEDVKIEVEENRVLRVSGEIKGEEEEEIEGEKWHRAERISGKFLRQFRLPANADLEKVEAHLENGVLRIAVPKLPDQEKKKEPKVINIAGGNGASAEAIKAEL